MSHENLTACEIWSLYPFQTSLLILCKQKVTCFSFAHLLTWGCVGKAAIPKKQQKWQE